MAPPQNLEAEEALVGCMLLSSSAREVVADAGVLAEDFYRPALRQMFDAVVALEARGEPVDPLTVINELKATGLLEAVGGRTAVLVLDERTPVVSNVRAYADEVLRMARRRGLEAAGRKAVELAHGSTPVDEALRLANAELFAVQDRMDGLAVGTKKSLAESVDAYLDNYGVVEGDATPRLPVCVPELQERIHGLRAGQVMVVGAYSGDGKTWLGLDAAESAALAGQRSAYFTMEMSHDELTERLLAMGGLDYTKLRREEVPLAVVRQAALRVAELPIDVFDTPRCTVATIRSEVARARAAGRPYRLVVVDHFHLLDWPGHRNDRQQLMEDGLRELKSMAKQFGFTLVLLAQLNEVESSRENPFPPPTLRSLRGTRALVHIADYMLFLWREREGTKVLPTTRLKLAKTRDLAAQSTTDTVTFSDYRFRGTSRPAIVEARPAQTAMRATSPEFPGFVPGDAYTNERGA